MGATEKGRLQKLCLAFPVASWGPMNAQSHSQDWWGWAASMFSFCSVCFLFRSTTQFWFGPLRADGVWQVRISGATHICLPQCCGLSSCQPLQEQEGLPALLTCQPLSFHFSLFSFSLSFLLSLSVCLYFLSLSLPLSLSPSLVPLSELVSVSFLSSRAFFIQ